MIIPYKYVYIYCYLPDVEREVDGDGNNSKSEYWLREQLLAVVINISKHPPVLPRVGVLALGVVDDEVLDRVVVLIVPCIYRVNFLEYLHSLLGPALGEQELRAFRQEKQQHGHGEGRY